VVAYNLNPYALANKGYLVNLKDTTNLNLEAPWWPEEFLSSMLYKDQIYALVDNASVGTVTNLSCIFFNNDLLEAKQLESPYDLVNKNEWTIPKLKELIKDTYEDKNGNGSAEGGTGGDLYGLVTSTAARITCWYYAAGLRFSSINEQGELIFNNDVEDATRRIEAIVDLFSGGDALVNEPKTQYIMFKEELAYFYLSNVSLASNMVNNNVNINYGVAPNPKLDSDQTRYYTHVPNTHDAWYLLKGIKDEECSSAFLEAMASEAYRKVNPVFFETNLKIRYAPDENLAQMYDIIRESITFDFVYLYGSVMGTDINTGIRNCIQNPDTYKWATVWAGIKDSMNTKFQQVLDTYDQNAAN
jgi:maltose-binding protein MalE